MSLPLCVPVGDDASHGCFQVAEARPRPVTNLHFVLTASRQRQWHSTETAALLFWLFWGWGVWAMVSSTVFTLADESSSRQGSVRLWLVMARTSWCVLTARCELSMRHVVLARLEAIFQAVTTFHYIILHRSSLNIEQAQLEALSYGRWRHRSLDPWVEVRIRSGILDCTIPNGFLNPCYRPPTSNLEKEERRGIWPWMVIPNEPASSCCWPWTWCWRCRPPDKRTCRCEMARADKTHGTRRRWYGTRTNTHTLGQAFRVTNRKKDAILDFSISFLVFKAFFKTNPSSGAQLKQQLLLKKLLKVFFSHG